MPDGGHDRFTRTLHWLTVLLVAGAWTLGEDAEEGGARFALHAGFGLMVLALTLPRLLWRGIHAIPSLPGAPRMQRAAGWAHGGLYVLLLAVPLLGAASVWARGQALQVFGLLQLPSPWPSQGAAARVLEGAHEISANLLLLLVGLHVAAALLHQWVLRDDLMGRMRLPWRR